MPLYDYECSECNCLLEFIKDADDSLPESCGCGGEMSRIVSFGSHFREEAPWIKTVLDVVNKGSDKAHVKEFLAHPSRSNYKRWMKEEGIRPYEPGEKPAGRNEQEFFNRQSERLMRKHYERKQVETHGR